MRRGLVVRRLLCGVASLAFHGAAAVICGLVWTFVLISTLVGGAPCNDPCVIRYRNPYWGRAAPVEEEEAGIIVRMPLRRRPLPEFGERGPEWDSSKLEYQSSPGRPSWVQGPPLRVGSSEKARGDHIDYVSDKQYWGTGTYDSAGAGGGGGGAYGGPPGGKDPVHLALLWLARHQNADGSWSGARLARCASRPPCDAGGGDDLTATGLAVLAFIGAGYGPGTGDTWDGIRYGDAVSRALAWISGRQQGGGRIAAEGSDLDGHAICTLAMLEVRRIAVEPLERLRRAASSAADPELREYARSALARIESGLTDAEPLRRGVAWAISSGAQSEWVVIMIKSALLAGIDVPHEAAERARSRLRHPEREKLLSEPGLWGAEGPLHQWYIATVALGRHDVPGHEGWRRLNDRIRDLLLRGQDRDEHSCRHGSWDADSGSSRVAATALRALVLEACPGYGYRFGPADW